MSENQEFVSMLKSESLLDEPRSIDQAARPRYELEAESSS